MQATVNFKTRHEANVFATKWTRFSKTGHTISGSSVTVYDVDEKGKAWIDGYVDFHNSRD